VCALAQGLAPLTAATEAASSAQTASITRSAGETAEDIELITGGANNKEPSDIAMRLILTSPAKSLVFLGQVILACRPNQWDDELCGTAIEGAHR
jgi:high-affinity K+ transport system ATPase subunit B